MDKGTALITGASAGLGERFATALAADGQDLILTARRADRLEALAGTLRNRFGVTAHVIAADLASPEGPDALFAEVTRRGLHIDTLINNAGFGLRGDFAAMDGPKQLAMIDLNVRSLVALCHLASPGMIARKRGAILNVASTAAFQPGPWMAIYYASKAFVLSFSESLHEEVKPHGVHVSALCPGPTRTEFFDVADMKDIAMFQRLAGDPDTVVRDGLNALKANRAVEVSGAMNAAMAGAVRFLPRGFARRLAGGMQRARQG